MFAPPFFDGSSRSRMVAMLARARGEGGKVLLIPQHASGVFLIFVPVCTIIDRRLGSKPSR
jgi:hypothetical protein